MDWVIEELTRQVANRLRIYGTTALAGGIVARLTPNEINRWNAYCHSHETFTALGDADRTKELALAHIKAGDASPEAEQRFIDSDKAYSELHRAMAEVASKWYGELCAESPRPGERK